MAKRSDHHSSGLQTDNTGGVLSGLLAEEEDLDRRALWRLGWWGVGAVAAVVVAVMANQSQLGWKRDQLAAADISQRAQQMQNIASHTERETRRLASAIDTLNSDRDRLYTRMTSLEQGLDSVTGAIARQSPPAASPAPPSPSAEPAPAVAPVTTQTAAATPEKTATNPTASEPNPTAISSVAKDQPREAVKEAVKADPIRIEGKRPEAAREIAKTEAVRPDAPTPATPLVNSKSFMAPPDPSASKLIEPSKPLSLSPVTASPIPEVVAAAPAEVDAEDETAPKAAVQRTQFGVDLGTANSVPALRVLWRGLLKSRSNTPLAALRPIMVIKESTNGQGVQLRLVAGPLNDAGAAAKICAVLAENKRSCETAIFDGQNLSMTGDDPAQAAKMKPSSRRRVPARRSAAVAEEAPKKPEPSAAVSTWFGKKGQ